MNVSIFGMTPAVLMAPFVGDVAAVAISYLWCSFVTYRGVKATMKKTK